MASWYVDNSVASSGNGQTWATAWKNFSNIVWASLAAGDTLYISGGSSGQTYTSELDVGKSGTSGHPITIMPGVDSGKNGRVTIDLGNTSGLIGIYNNGYNYVIIQGFYIQNVGEAGIKVDGSTAGVLVQYNHVYSGAGAGSPNNARGYTIKNCAGTDCVILKNNFFTTPTSTTSQTDGIYSENNNGVKIISNSLVIPNTDTTEHSDGIQSFQDISVDIIGNFVSHPNGGRQNHGIYIEDIKTGGQVRVNNNVIYMPVGDEAALVAAMHVAGWNGKMLAYHNTIYGGWPAVWFDGAPAATEIKNNIVYPAFGRYGYQVDTATPPSSGNIDYNVVYGPTNGYLTAFCADSSGTAACRSTTSKSSGKVYFEAKTGAFWAGNNSGIGLANSTQSLTTWMGQSGNNSVGYYVAGGVYINGSAAATYQTYSANHTLAFAVDVTNKLLWVKNLTTASNWNNSGTANPATGAGGLSFSAITGPYYVAISASSGDDSVTINFGTSAFAGTVPSGFSAWDNSATLNPSDCVYPITLSITAGLYNGTAKSWSQWQALGYDTHGYNSDPLFVNTITPDLYISSSSPAKNHGASLSITTDYDGNTRDASPDIGAYEALSTVLTILPGRSTT